MQPVHLMHLLSNDTGICSSATYRQTLTMWRTRFLYCTPSKKRAVWGSDIRPWYLRSIQHQHQHQHRARSALQLKGTHAT